MDNYIGIDYSLGISNVDQETGIHFGVISQNSINLDYTEDFEYDYGTPHCGQCGNEALDSHEAPENIEEQEWFDRKDFYCQECEQCYWSDSVYSEEALGWSYQSDGYELVNCLDNEIMVLKSPYYTFAQYCSPCVPGAGNLNTPVDGGPKTFCLGPDWFEEDNPMPYKCFRVSDDSVVE